MRAYALSRGGKVRMSTSSWDEESVMAKASKDRIEDEPGAEDRFISGVRKALETPHKPLKKRVGDAKRGKRTGGKDVKRG